jgi:glycosyltransferase involved in cell wall biosynthesis
LRIAAYVRGYPGVDDYNRDYTSVFDQLALAGHQVTVLAVPGQGQTERGPVLEGIFSNETDTVRNARRASRWIAAHASRYDAVFGAGWWDPVTHALALGAIRRGVPAVISPWASLNPYALDRSWTGVPKRVAIALLRMAYGRPGPTLQLYAPTDEQHLRALGLRWRHFVAPLGLYDTEPASRTLDWEAVLGPIAKGRRILLFNARLDLYQKGYDALIGGLAAAAEKRGSSFRTILVLSGRPAAGRLAREAEDARRLAGPLVARRTAVYLGEVTASLRRDMIAHCDGFIYPSRVDGPPRPLREALSRSTPLVATHETGLGHWIEQFDAGLAIRAPEPAAIASAIVEFDSAPPERLGRWRAGAAKLATRLAWSSCYKDYEVGLVEALAAVKTTSEPSSSR